MTLTEHSLGLKVVCVEISVSTKAKKNFFKHCLAFLGSPDSSEYFSSNNTIEKPLDRAKRQTDALVNRDEDQALAKRGSCG